MPRHVTDVNVVKALGVCNRLGAFQRGHRRNGQILQQVLGMKLREVQRHVRADGVLDAGDEVGDRFGRGDPERVDGDHFLRAGLDRAPVYLREKVEVGPGAVDAEERNVDPCLGARPYGVFDPPEHRLARDAECVELEIRDWRLDDGVGQTEVDDRLHVLGHGT